MLNKPVLAVSVYCRQVSFVYVVSSVVVQTTTTTTTTTKEMKEPGLKVKINLSVYVAHFMRIDCYCFTMAAGSNFLLSNLNIIKFYN